MFYDYRCPKCEKIEEDIQHGMTETPEIICEDCNEKMKIIVAGGTSTVYKDEFGYAKFGNKEKPRRYKLGGVAVDMDKKKEMNNSGETGIAKKNVF